MAEELAVVISIMGPAKLSRRLASLTMIVAGCRGSLRVHVHGLFLSDRLSCFRCFELRAA